MMMHYPLEEQESKSIKINISDQNPLFSICRILIAPFYRQQMCRILQIHDSNLSEIEAIEVLVLEDLC